MLETVEWSWQWLERLGLTKDWDWGFSCGCELKCIRWIISLIMSQWESWCIDIHFVTYFIICDTTLFDTDVVWLKYHTSYSWWNGKWILSCCELPQLWGTYLRNRCVMCGNLSASCLRYTRYYVKAAYGHFWMSYKTSPMKLVWCV